MKIKMNKFNPSSVRKLKYGSIALALTLVTVAAVILVNVIFSSLAYKNNWYIDMSKSGVYELSDAGRAMLDDITADINIRFCRPFDELEQNGMSQMILSLVREMAANYDNITYDYIDIIKDPTSVVKYKTTTGDTIDESYVIVESGKNFRKFKNTSLFVTDEDGNYVGFNGEYKLISAMVQITQTETPIAYFTTTHGESISGEMVSLFVDAGFEVLPIDLTTQEIEEGARVVVISNPIYDFEGISEATKGRKSEIEKIDDFLDSFGNIMVFVDPDTGELPELFDFLGEWGIVFEEAVLKDPENSLDTGHYALVGEYSVEEGDGASLIKSITSLKTPPKTVISYARPLKLLWSEKNNRATSTVIYTSDKAEKYVDGEKTETGRYPLVAVSFERRYVDNTPHYSYVYACGSKYLTDSDYIGQKAYGNSDVVFAMMRQMGRNQVPVDLKYKLFDNEALTITTSEATKWTVVLTVVLPLIFLVAGIAVWLRRKHA